MLQILPAGDHILAVVLLYGVGGNKGAVLEEVPSQLHCGLPCTQASIAVASACYTHNFA